MTTEMNLFIIVLKKLSKGTPISKSERKKDPPNAKNISDSHTFLGLKTSSSQRYSRAVLYSQ